MNALVNYIENGTGRGLKKFLAFTFVLCVLLGISMYSLIYKAADEKVQEFFKQVPQVVINDGKIVSPEKTYMTLSFLDGDEGGFVLDTTGEEFKMPFANGIYVTTEKVYIKNGTSLNMAELSDIPNSVLTAKEVNSFVQKSVSAISGILALLLFVILWIGYALLYIAVKLFFLIIGRTTCPYVRGRSVFVAWTALLTLDVILMIFGYGYSLPLAFALALFLAILIIFKTPLHSMDMEETLAAVVKMPVTPDEVVMPAKKVVAKTKPIVKKVTPKVVQPVKKAVVKKTMAKAKVAVKKVGKK